MYRTSVPMINRTFARDDRERVVATLHEMGVFRVILATGTYHFDRKVFEEELAILRDNTAFLHAHGFEVGAWMWSFWDMREDSPYTRIRLLSGEDSSQSVCCTDERFCAFAADYLCEIAKCGVDLVLYDDDYRYGYLQGGVGCLCDNHLKMMGELLGETLTREQVVPYLLTGGENRYRSAWQESKRQALLGFAGKMRRALDTVAPQVRLGVCACFTVWDLDGASAAEISRALAGNTEPFLRLIGAPYWAVKRSMGGHRLQDVIEEERMLLGFCDGEEDMEILAEGDTYPRPRWICPASYLEGFDTAMRADGRASGIFKYALDYTSSLSYEMGYIHRHLANLPLYGEIEAHFGGKTAVGVRVWEMRQRYEHGELPPAVTSERDLALMSFSYAARMLAAASIPTTYDATDCVGIAFGENARTLPLSACKHGLILDLHAARILRERGVDVGLAEVGEWRSVGTEIFMGDGDAKEFVALQDAKGYVTKLSAGAQVQSVFALIDARLQTGDLFASQGGETPNVTPASYTYENANGERFLVFCFDGQLASDALLRNYARGAQLARTLSYLAREPFVATVLGSNPDLYVMAKEKDGALAVGLWNFCPDAIDAPVVTLGRSYESLDVIGGNGTLTGKTVTLSRLEPYGFMAFEVR